MMRPKKEDGNLKERLTPEEYRAYMREEQRRSRERRFPKKEKVKKEPTPPLHPHSEALSRKMFGITVKQMTPEQFKAYNNAKCCAYQMRKRREKKACQTNQDITTSE